ncbi:TMEM43 family protein [Marilutibacter chinensis]|uniref:TMEM43 family protein n=1 Tax=Marilutibacter chinensis TaxID=2912247 RepID=A0ABS9HVL5_9GAMM|nr:TMEM43 family protein [Lysobacter chinensis]MCF7222743.1 TMEM43 family protein [Lysobacter chinensis]
MRSRLHAAFGSLRYLAVSCMLAVSIAPAGSAQAFDWAQQAPVAGTGNERTDGDAVGEPVGELDPGAPIVDRDFGVSTRSAGLDRQVEMYQWRLHRGEYQRVWNAARIDSSDFDDAHRNPPFLLDNRRWWSDDARLDGRPVDQEVLQALGEWRVFRPGFSRLPLNMAATFQPEGDGLGSAENPLQPQIGDLRIRWRELVLPPLQGRVVFRDGAWRLRPSAAPGAAHAAAPAAARGAAAASRSGSSDDGTLSWWWLSLPLVLLLILALWRRSPKGKR